MSNTIYYFTGSGNSLSVARALANRLEGFEILPMVKAVDRKENVEADILGLVFPVYMYNIPHIVRKFIGRIKKARYIFAAVTNGGGPGAAVARTRAALRARGLELHAGFAMQMPANYTPMGGPESPDERKILFADAENAVDAAAKTIREGGTAFVPTPDVFDAHVWPGLFYNLGYAAIPVMGKVFKSDENCNGCGICERVCPSGNIAMSGSKPAWKTKCEQCYACVHWCPRSSIQFGKSTKGVERYRHPEISLNDMISQKA